MTVEQMQAYADMPQEFMILGGMGGMGTPNML